MWYQSVRSPLGAAIGALSAVVLTSAGAAADSTPQPFDDSAIEGTSVTFGGAQPLATTRTVPHWSGEAVNGLDGVTYRFSMVGVDPSTETTATVGVDIIPIDVTVGDRAFNGSEAVAGVVASPLFHNANYSWTPATTFSRRGGPLSAGNTDVQLLDATMRSQFDKAGTDYHLVLDTPVVFDPVNLDIPDGKAVAMLNSRGFFLAALDDGWFQTRVQNLLGKLHLDPTHLAIFLTKNVVLFADHDPAHCCGLGGHGAGHATGGLGGPVNGNGNQPVQTFVWSSWLTPGVFTTFANRDIVGLTHEITEWATDPFNINTVQGWSSPNSVAVYGCSNLLETGDPTFGIGFAAGTNTFDQNPWGDGYYHVQDEAFLPWFMRTTPNDTSQATQVPSQFGGRYTFMGSLNPFPWFHQPAIPC